MHFYRYTLRLALPPEPWSLWSQGEEEVGEEVGEEEVMEGDLEEGG
jgi:hypothetical protein